MDCQGLYSRNFVHNVWIRWLIWLKVVDKGGLRTLERGSSIHSEVRETHPTPPGLTKGYGPLDSTLDRRRDTP